MQDAWRSYVELALGLTEASRKQAMKVAGKLTKRSGATVEQLQQIAEDLTETSAQNREALVKLIRYELDRALGAIGLATADEVAELTDRIRNLEIELRDAQARAKAAEAAAAAAGRSAVEDTGTTRLTPSSGAATAADGAADKRAAKAVKKAVRKAGQKTVRPPGKRAAEESTPAEGDAQPTPAERAGAQESTAKRTEQTGEGS